MKLFDFFQSSKKEQVDGEVTNALSTENEVTNDQQQKDGSDDKVVITYGTGLPIDLIYSFLKHDYQEQGYKDALVNPDPAYKEMNLSIIKHQLEVKFKQVRLAYESRLETIKQRSNVCMTAGMLETASQLDVEKEIYEHHLEELTKMEKDYQDAQSYMHGMLLSYESGFMRGLGAIAIGAVNVNPKREEL